MGSLCSIDPVTTSNGTSEYFDVRRKPISMDLILHSHSQLIHAPYNMHRPDNNIRYGCGNVAVGGDADTISAILI